MRPVFIAFIVFFCMDSFAQVAKEKAIYYLVDTAKIPANDRVMYINTTGRIKQYTIEVPCVSHQFRPVLFYSDTAKTTIIKCADLKKITLSNIGNLAGISCAFYNDKSNFKYNIFLIEPYKKEFIMHKAQVCHSGTICY